MFSRTPEGPPVGPDHYRYIIIEQPPTVAEPVMAYAATGQEAGVTLGQLTKRHRKVFVIYKRLLLEPAAG